MQNAPIPATQTPIHTHRSLIKHSLTHATYRTGSYQTQAGSYFEFLNILLFVRCFFLFIILSTSFSFICLCNARMPLFRLGTKGTIYFGYFGCGMHLIFVSFLFSFFCNAPNAPNAQLLRCYVMIRYCFFLLVQIT